jgi:hypothetical protein
MGRKHIGGHISWLPQSTASHSFFPSRDLTPRAPRRTRIEAFHANRSFASGGEKEPYQAAQSRGDVSHWRALCHFPLNQKAGQNPA